MKEMKTIVLTGIRKFVQKEAPKATPAKGEVLIRIRHVGICGSDIHYWKQGKIGSQVVEYPFIIGHECSGEIAELGEGVTGFKPGQRVAIEPAVSCGQCEFCRTGRNNICPKVRFLGTPPTEGAFREFLTMPCENVFPLADNISFEEGVLLEPFTIGVYSVILSSLLPGSTVAVMGCGPIGFSTLIAAKAAGASQIFATDLIDERLNTVSQIGADFTYNASKGSAVDFIMEKTNGRGVDISFEAAGEQEAVSDAVASTRIGGRCVIIGIPVKETIEINCDIARRREIPIINVRRQNHAVARAIALGSKNITSLKKMLTHRFKSEKISEAFEVVSQRKDGVIKAVIEM